MSKKKNNDDVKELVNEAMEIETPEQAALMEMESKKQALQDKLENNVWGYSKLGLTAKSAAMQMLSTKNGMYAKIPLYCKVESCPYSETCMMLKMGLAIEGEPCFVETSEIELRAASYAQDFELDDSSFTDRVIVSEIVNLDIMIERCKALMAKEGTPVVDVVISVSEDGEPIMGPQVSKAVEAYEKFSNRRDKLYQMMLATRKDKKVDTTQEYGIHDIIAQALSKEENQEFIIDTKPEDM